MKMFEGYDWNTFLDEIAGIESKGSGGYKAKGGSGNHYDGKYQLGAAAKVEAGKILGIELLHTPAAREAFRNDPELQEQAMKANTMFNHKALINKQGDAYTNLPDDEKLEMLAYAHNQGAGGASAWMDSGVAKKDGFGTAGDKYSKAFRKAIDSSTPLDYAAYYAEKAIPDWVQESASAIGDGAVSLYDDAMNWVGGLGGVDDVEPTQPEMYSIQGSDSDGLGMVAQRAGVPFATIMELNPNIDYNRINVGQQIRIR